MTNDLESQQKYFTRCVARFWFKKPPNVLINETQNQPK